MDPFDPGFNAIAQQLREIDPITLLGNEGLRAVQLPPAALEALDRIDLRPGFLQRMRGINTEL